MIVRRPRLRSERRSNPRPLTAALLVLLSLAAVGHAAAPAPAAFAAPAVAAPAVSILAAAQPAELTIGRALTVNGRELEGAAPLAGRPLVLQSAPYPYTSFAAIAHTSTAADGSFSFDRVTLGLNSRLRVLAQAPAAGVSATLQVIVDPAVALASRSLGPGRVRLSVRVVHGREAGGAAGKAHWYLAPRGSRRYTPAGSTPLRESATGVSRASTIVNPPSRRFSYRVCLNPGWEAAMGPPGAHGACPDHPFTLAPSSHTARARAKAAFEYGGEGRGTPLPPFPSQHAIAAAERWLDSRAGATGMAVLDSGGRLSGVRMRAHFETASVIKVMFLAAYLQRLSAAHGNLAEGDRALLYPMIHESNNNAASAVLGAVGEGAVERVAREAGMRDYAPGVGWWAYSQTSAADQAQLLWRLGSIVPSRFYGYARYLMSTIEPEQSWGFPPVARPRWQVYFKTGALPERGLFTEVARLERGGVAFSVAVLTDHDPSMAYGEETIAGVARALLGAQ
ncbi:MAG: serine hydrolase [Solirubrobacteraceae bacterium]